MNEMHEDEISLYDVWQVICKHRKLFWIVFVVIMIEGTIYTLLQQKQYEFTRAIKVPGYYSNTEFVPVESNKSLIRKVDALFMPMIFEKYNRTNIKYPKDFKNTNFGIEDIGSGYLLLGAQGTLKDKSIYLGFFNELLERINLYINPLIAISKQYLSTSLKTTKAQLANQIDMDKVLLKAAIADGTKLTEASNPLITNALNGPQIIRQLGAVQGRVTLIGLRISINQMQQMLSTIKQGYFTTDTIRSLPTGVSKIMLIMLFFIVAIIVGLMSTFIREFFALNHKK